ncbi:DeoR/GlpR family DNA-binding transcription regulator [Arthrobacter sp. ISL-28]|uniref:DeoR/GlpR family DNA-binding transcription regulator n=1 Tax=Arthrobacter sp. ISL-28 TaxID=2819108 RepID=UPI001BE83282|nr:DeoR/GlpR family DNA-binding transcription regulator [Arthrobacter sp. ISL-28]MBT2520422.1 DeoR/GlpR transcriptional regulator [Arthrobacter sp. ISL-28]
MLAAQRQHRILQELEAHGTVRVTSLSGMLGVSEMTVRRDIDALDAEGLLLRVHGGATRTGAFGAIEPEFLSKSAHETEAKRAIAAEALRLLRPDMTLLISGGTTTYELARLLPRNLGLTVVTNSIMVANALAGPAQAGPAQTGAAQTGAAIRTVILGGQRTPSEALVGPVTIHAMENLSADLCFMGVHGIDARAGVTSPNLLEAEVNAAMIAASDELVVVADATKYGLLGLAGIAPLSAIGILITDARIGMGEDGSAALSLLQEAVRDVRIVPVPSSSEHPPRGTPGPAATNLHPHLPAGRNRLATAFKGHNG